MPLLSLKTKWKKNGRCDCPSLLGMVKSWPFLLFLSRHRARANHSPGASPPTLPPPQVFALSPRAPVLGPPRPLPSVLPPVTCTKVRPECQRETCPVLAWLRGSPSLSSPVFLWILSLAPIIVGCFTFGYLHVPCLGRSPLPMEYSPWRRNGCAAYSAPCTWGGPVATHPAPCSGKGVLHGHSPGAVHLGGPVQ